MKTLKQISIFTFAALLGLSSCKKEEEPEQQVVSPDTSNQQSSMKVRMTDNPGNFKALDVEITSVSAFNSTTNEWIELEGDAQTVSVLELTNGDEQEIASETNIDAGLYTMIKIDFSQNNKLTLNSTASAGLLGSVINVSVNAGSTTTVNESVIVNINQEVSSNTSASLLLDFNVVNSVMQDSNDEFFLDPSITLIEDEETGVMGSIENDTRAAITFQSTTSSSTSFSGFTNEDGEFMLRGMIDGEYTVTINPDQDEDSSLNASYNVSNVTVVDGRITNMGELDLQ